MLINAEAYREPAAVFTPAWPCSTLLCWQSSLAKFYFTPQSYRTWMICKQESLVDFLWPLGLVVAQFFYLLL